MGKAEKMGDGGKFKRSLGSTRGTSRPGYEPRGNRPQGLLQVQILAENFFGQKIHNGYKKSKSQKSCTKFHAEKLSTIATFSIDPHRIWCFLIPVLNFCKQRSENRTKPLEKTKTVCYKCVFVTLWEKLRKWEVEDNSGGL